MRARPAAYITTVDMVSLNQFTSRTKLTEHWNNPTDNQDVSNYQPTQPFLIGTYEEGSASSILLVLRTYFVSDM